MKYFLDCEFDGHNGPLLSMALIGENNQNMYLLTDHKPTDPWVIEHVVPHLLSFGATDMFGTLIPINDIGGWVRTFLHADKDVTIYADSPVDIGIMCNVLSTKPDGRWSPFGFDLMYFIVHNVDCYPTELVGAVQHNAYWDALALKHKLKQLDLV